MNSYQYGRKFSTIYIGHTAHRLHQKHTLAIFLDFQKRALDFVPNTAYWGVVNAISEHLCVCGGYLRTPFSSVADKPFVAVSNETGFDAIGKCEYAKTIAEAALLAEGRGMDALYFADPSKKLFYTHILYFPAPDNIGAGDVHPYFKKLAGGVYSIKKPILLSAF